MQGVRIDWGRVIGLWAVLIALVVTFASCAEVATADELPIPLAVQTIIGECADCSVDGMVAVGNVIRNRMAYRGQTADEVVLAPKQFSCWNDGRERMRAFVEANASVIDAAWAAWQASGTDDLTNGADLYHADYVKPRWDWSRTEYKGKFGRHLFYRELTAK